MKSAPRGKITSGVEVTKVTARGFWLLLERRALFLPYRAFPWFRDATVREITSVRRPSQGHLYWPALDVDLAVESIEHPERFPRVSRFRATRVSRRTLTSRRSSSGPRSPSRGTRR
jgi:Protein of unknown function (DUF2442)